MGDSEAPPRTDFECHRQHPNDVSETFCRFEESNPIPRSRRRKKKKRLNQITIIYLVIRVFLLFFWIMNTIAEWGAERGRDSFEPNQPNPKADARSTLCLIAG